MIRVLTVTSRLSQFGGIPVAIRTLLRRSDPSNFVHYVCQLRPLVGDEDDGSMPSLGAIFSLDFRGNRMRSAGTVGASIRLLSLIRTLRPDVVHLHTGTSVIAVPSKLILGDSCTWLLDLHEPLAARHSALTSAVVAWVARHDTWCVTHSPPVTDEISSTLAIPESRLVLIPLGIDPDRFEAPSLSRDEWRAAYGFSHDVTIVATVGKVSDVKGIWRLLEVVEKCRSHRPNGIVFTVIGRSGQGDAVNARIRSRGLQDSVRLLGFIEDLPSALNAADIYFAPSNYEGFGISVVEAMAAGLPVVASAVGGLSYVVEDGKTGYLVPPADIEGFSNAIDLLHLDPQHRLELGRLGRLRVRENFDERLMAAGYEDLYQHMMGSTGT